MEPAEKIPVPQFKDNDELVFEVDIDGPFWKGRRDPTRRVNVERVTKGKIREMFVTFVQGRPDLRGKPRKEQILAFNLARREERLEKIDDEILEHVLI
jgi:hypothetical protein